MKKLILHCKYILLSMFCSLYSVYYAMGEVILDKNLCFFEKNENSLKGRLKIKVKEKMNLFNIKEDILAIEDMTEKEAQEKLKKALLLKVKEHQHYKGKKFRIFVEKGSFCTHNDKDYKKKCVVTINKKNSKENFNFKPFKFYVVNKKGYKKLNNILKKIENIELIELKEDSNAPYIVGGMIIIFVLVGFYKKESLQNYFFEQSQLNQSQLNDNTAGDDDWDDWDDWDDEA